MSDHSIIDAHTHLRRRKAADGAWTTPSWLSGYAIANGVRFHYHRTGGDGPPLVLSHGITDNGLCWTRTAQVLQADFEVIMVDARGHGLSDAPDAGYAPEDRAADLAGIIHALGLERPALLGHSMGADTSAFAAALYPDLASCVVLEDPPWGETILSAEGKEAIAEGLRARTLARRSRPIEDVIAAGCAEHPAWEDIELVPWAQAKPQFSLDAFQVIPGLRADWREVVSQIACPVLLITGNPELGGLVTPAAAADLTTRNPYLKVAHIKGAGHNIRRDCFEPYVAAVVTFLTEARLARSGDFSDASRANKSPRS